MFSIYCKLINKFWSKIRNGKIGVLSRKYILIFILKSLL